MGDDRRTARAFTGAALAAVLLGALAERVLHRGIEKGLLSVAAVAAAIALLDAAARALGVERRSAAGHPVAAVATAVLGLLPLAVYPLPTTASAPVLVWALGAFAVDVAAARLARGGVAPEGAPRVSGAKRLAFAAVVLGVNLGLLELGCRLVYAHVVPKGVDETYDRMLARKLDGTVWFAAYRPHPYTCYDLVPDYEDFQGRWHTSDGFSLPEMPRGKRPGVYRIACTGGSTTYEPSVSRAYTFCAYLEEFLNRSFPGRKIEVLNAGVPAYNSGDTFARFHYRVLDYSPDMIVNYDGVNDVWPMLCRGPFENDFRHARKTMEPFSGPGPVTAFLCRHAWSIRLAYLKLVLGGRVPDIMSLTYQDQDLGPECWKTYEQASSSAFRRNLEDTSYICRGRGIRLVLATCALDPFETGRDWKKNPRAIFFRGVDDLNAVVKEIAAKHDDVALVDFDRLMPRNAADGRPEDRFFNDICHTLARGNRAKANIFGKVIASALEKEFGTKAVPFALDVAPAKDGAYAPARIER